MRLFYIAVNRGHAQEITDPGYLSNALRQADHEHRALEHSRIHVSSAGACGVLFFNGLAPANTYDYCCALVIRALDEAPDLDGWYLSNCAPLATI
ncbi:hypothetical protein ACIQWN_36985 [Streptomyces vinaceus]|uniref:hypothetical protein n=1 Tax=Streptomyces vinaceus TaxID=1960 RepID=UPI00380333F8